MTEGDPAAGPSPMAFTGLAADPEGQGRETLLSPPFGEAAGATVPDSSALFPVDIVAGWWDPAVAPGGGGGKWFSSWQGRPALSPPQAALPPAGFDRGQGWPVLLAGRFPLSAFLLASLPRLLPQASPPLSAVLFWSFMPFPQSLSLLSSLLPFIPFFPHFLSSRLLSFFSVRIPPLSPALLAVYPARWSAPLSGGCPPAKGGAGTEHSQEQPGWQLTLLAWGSSSPPDGDRGLCSLSSNSMLATRIALKFTDLTTDH